MGRDADLHRAVCGCETHLSNGIACSFGPLLHCRSLFKCNTSIIRKAKSKSWWIYNTEGRRWPGKRQAEPIQRTPVREGMIREGLTRNASRSKPLTYQGRVQQESDVHRRFSICALSDKLCLPSRTVAFKVARGSTKSQTTDKTSSSVGLSNARRLKKENL